MRARACILYYHRVGPFRPNQPRRLTVTPENFRAQMYFLKRVGIPVISLDQLMSRFFDFTLDTQHGPKGRRSPGATLFRKAERLCVKGGPSVVLTFDDGHEDLVHHAVPILESLKFPATFFIVTGHVGEVDSWNRPTGLRPERTMSWGQIRELARRGFTIGSHSVTHLELDELPEADVRFEIMRSKEDLEQHLGVPVNNFSYPKGRYNESVKAAVMDAGYSSACATRSGRADDRFALQRIPVSATDSLFAFASKIVKAWTGYYRKFRARPG